MLIKDFKRPKFNIQLFAGEPGAGGEGGTGGAGEIEVPDYINTYVSEIEDEGQREYLSGLTKDEKGLGALKNLIKDPKADWTLDTASYKDKLADTDKFVEAMKKDGYSEGETKKAIENRISYLEAEREAMPVELREADTVVNNFINQEQDPAMKAVLERLGENATGRKMLLDYMKLKGGPATPGSNAGSGQPGAGEYNQETFREAFQIANKKADKQKLSELKAFATVQKEKGESFYLDYMM